MTEDPLAELLVDRPELARKELAEALKPYLGITPEGTLVFEETFEELPTLERVACLLLAFRAANMLGIREDPGASPQEIVDTSGMAGGTVRPKLSQLLRERLVVRQNKQYLVPDHATRRVASLLRTEAD